MPQTTRYIRVGQILKPLGTSGALKVDIQDDFFDDIVASDHLFVKINGHFVPYFIEDLKETNHLLLKIEDINSPESASAFTLKDLYLREKDITSEKYADQISKEGWVGFKLYDRDELIGIIDDIEIYPQQIMGSVNYKNKKILIPLVDAFIKTIDEDNNILIMELPEGLLDM